MLSKALGAFITYTHPAGSKSTGVQVLHMCVCVLGGRGWGVGGRGECGGGGGGGKFTIHKILIAELYSFSPPSKLALITVSGQVP